MNRSEIVTCNSQRGLKGHRGATGPLSHTFIQACVSLLHLSDEEGSIAQNKDAVEKTEVNGKMSAHSQGNDNRKEFKN